jgi:succinate-semialdehyde dehydrogenase/glutarate-semialdehyde dehydrogenase
MGIATIDPATGETIKTFDTLSDDELWARIERATHAARSYRLTTFRERAAMMRRVAELLDADCEDIARVITSEMGKTLSAARAEVIKSADIFRFYAAGAEGFLADEHMDTTRVGNPRASFVRYQPLGVVLAIMPWNFPLWQVARFAAPALMAGNVGLLKHASNVPQTALLIEEVLERAGLPAGAFQVLFIEARKAGEVLADRRVRGATFTGSSAGGAAVAAEAGGNIKKTVLELGGSDPYVILPSADVDAAARVGVIARAQNNGQSCIAAKRFIIHESIAEEFEQAFVEGMCALRVGHPTEAGTDIGPLATEAGRKLVVDQVEDARSKGATILCGGTAPSQPGWYFPPTVISGITPEMRIYHEEVFAPVAQLYRVPDVEQALDLANITDYGLGANVWTRDDAEEERFIRDFEAGMVFVNGTTTSYPELPFGGIKDSGYGRELGGAHGIREFCNVKTVWVGPGHIQTLDRVE